MVETQNFLERAPLKARVRDKGYNCLCPRWTRMWACKLALAWASVLSHQSFTIPSGVITFRFKNDVFVAWTRLW